MHEEVVKRFLNKYVKLVHHGYAIRGRITEITEDCIIFKSKQTESAISLNAIDSIVLLGGGGC